MRPFTTHTGIVAAMDRPDVDTDQIIPKQFLKRIERTGFGQYLFFDWRFRSDGSDNPQFELNRPEHKSASILLTRRNFGCGSSREHAPWALEQYGFRVLIAPTFADIFYNNCFQNGLLPIRLEESVVEQLFQRAHQHSPYQLTVDLNNCTIRDEHGLSLKFDIDPFRRECLLQGHDQISLTLKQEEKIAAFEKASGMTPAG